MPFDGKRSDTCVSAADGNGNNSTLRSSADIPGEIRERERMKLQVLSRKAAERTGMLKRSSHKLLETSRKLLSESLKKYERCRERIMKPLKQSSRTPDRQQ